MALRTSSTTEVPSIHLYSSVCVQLPWFIASAQAEHNGNISLWLFLYGSTGWYSFLGGRTLHFIIPLPIQTVRETICTRIHFRVTNKELAVLTNVGVQTDNVHITDFFPLLNSVVCFRCLGSTPVQGISIIF